ncbi:MAG: Na+/H+ antiporter NhaA, partial [Candidatus Competibacteraceae bacterium]|nr:Na+/H+ antiporter NhaA [Candidatus Competibacteraceae bacterium]
MEKKSTPNATSWERAFSRVLTPFEEFIHGETTSGVLLMVCAAIALLIANSPLAEPYAHLLHTHLSLNMGPWVLDQTLHHWINDGLMALFFFLVGLEIKREVLVGELSVPRQAALPIIAAIGGMVVPALIYILFNFGGEGARGWGVPMATDIAFAVGVLVLLGSRVPRSLFTFLVALAIVDDLGAVMVIALFYTESLDLVALGIGVLLVAVLVAMNRGGIRRTWPYAAVGLALWLAMLVSGVHATLAGVLTALTIPARSRYEPGIFSIRVRDLMDLFDARRRTDGSTNPLRNAELRGILQTLENGVRQVETPLQR